MNATSSWLGRGKASATSWWWMGRKPAGFGVPPLRAVSASRVEYLMRIEVVIYNFNEHSISGVLSIKWLANQLTD